MNIIKELRESKKISGQTLADSLGWLPSRLRNYENNIRKPGLKESREIVWALNRLGVKCSLDTVFPPEAASDKAEKEQAA
ncbi:helix-turn-helix domain-containing protein [Alteromonas macleodii]|uniref:helix-turn-helix transcriptional regulator n=1 Tax=Alteromonas macleodii TaxID=28108 RepID=UPI0031400B75